MRVRLYYKNVSEIMGKSEIGLLVLVDEDMQRQLTIPCDRGVVENVLAHYDPTIKTSNRLPEALWQMIRFLSDDLFEIILVDVVDGTYKTLLYNVNTYDTVMIDIGDAVLLSVIGDLPIYAEQKLMQRQSVPYTEGDSKVAIPVNAISKEMIEEALEKAIEEENYELASQLRDELQRRKKGMT